MEKEQDVANENTLKDKKRGPAKVSLLSLNINFHIHSNTDTLTYTQKSLSFIYLTQSHSLTL
jgi:hypothetical protein